MRQHTIALCLYWVVFILLLKSNDSDAAATTKFTNLQCEMLDPKLGSFQNCRLNLIKRGVVAANVYMKLYQVPTKNVLANVALYKKANGYKPFLYNFTIDYCEYAKRTTSNMVLNIIMRFITPYSNMNHTCPFDHDLIVKDMILPEDKFRLVPLPTGEYMLKFQITTNNDWQFSVKAFFLRIE